MWIRIYRQLIFIYEKTFLSYFHQPICYTIVNFSVSRRIKKKPMLQLSNEIGRHMRHDSHGTDRPAAGPQPEHHAHRHWPQVHLLSVLKCCSDLPLQTRFDPRFPSEWAFLVRPSSTAGKRKSYCEIKNFNWKIYIYICVCTCNILYVHLNILFIQYASR